MKTEREVREELKKTGEKINRGYEACLDYHSDHMKALRNHYNSLLWVLEIGFHGPYILKEKKE